MGHANAAQCFEGFDASNVPTRADTVHEQGIETIDVMSRRVAARSKGSVNTVVQAAASNEEQAA
jgi:hypothetical protein